MGIFDKLLDKFKLESTREIERASIEEDPKEIDIDAQTIYFKDGKMYKVSPTDEESWYDARYLVSDTEMYDLENVKSIQSIKVPDFGLQNDFEGYGVKGSLDYVLRMKAGNLFNRNEKELCSACLWKATELMFANKYMVWRKHDYERLIYWHIQLGMFDEVEKAKNYLTKNGFIFTEVESENIKKRIEGKTKKKEKIQAQPKKSIAKSKKQSQPNLSYAEKEDLIVKRVTIEDMLSLDNVPFVCNTEIKKFIKSGGHPFAYMDIVGENLDIAKNEIEKINKLIKNSVKEYPEFPKGLKIDFKKLVFYHKEFGYTRIICTPKTFTGKLSKYPYSLNFMTDLSNRDVNTHGELVYGLDGKVQKASICFWKNYNHVFLKYKTIDGKLTLSSIE